MKRRRAEGKRIGDGKEGNEGGTPHGREENSDVCQLGRGSPRAEREEEERGGGEKEVDLD